MSILSTYDEVMAREVYAEERIEQERVEIAKKLIRRNRPTEEIMEDTGLSESVITQLRMELGGIVSA